jgi:hypothetical protein
MRKLTMGIALVILLCLHLEARAQEPVTLTIGRTAYCYSLDSAQKVARLDASDGMEAASSLFGELDDCQMGAGQLMVLGVISTHKVSRAAGPKVLTVYEAANPMISFYVITTQQLLKEDPEA